MDTTTTAKLLAIPTAFALTGYYTFASQNAVPLLMDQPASVAAPIFTHVYHRGAAFVLPTTLISAAALGYLAYSVPEHRKSYATAAVLTVATQPWTVFVMMGGIKRIIAIGASAVEQEKVGAKGEVAKLIGTWVAQNFVRAGSTLVGGLVGLWAALEK